jgi:hypothetical protein
MRVTRRCCKMTDPEEIRAQLEEAEAELAAVYRKVWPLREAYAEANPPAILPPRRSRTDKQALIARCPRCGGRIEDEDAG